MVRVLAEDGLLETMPDPLGGNRNQLSLTAAGEQLVARWGTDLEERLARLLEAAGVPYRAYLAHTKRLLAALDAPRASRERQPARSARPQARSHT
jgi:DNA-binding MarR family transcriptional regulator